MTTAENEELLCQDLVETITDYLEGVLPAGERSRFEMHLDDCPGCRAYVEQFRTTIDAVGRLGVEPLPANERMKLLDIFREWRKT